MIKGIEREMFLGQLRINKKSTTKSTKDAKKKSYRKGAKVAKRKKL